MGAVTVSNIRAVGSPPWNPSRTLLAATVTFSSSYATGGDTLATAMGPTFLNLRAIFKIFVGGDAEPFLLPSGSVAPAVMAGGSYEVRLGGTSSAPTLILRKGGTTPAEESNATNVSTVSCTVLFEGEI